jgi:addiction module HigA family antidote
MVRLPKNRAPIHPGEILLEEFLKPLGLTQVDLADRIGVSIVRVNEIVKGKRGVTPDTALRLAKCFSTSADVWLGLQQSWDLYEAQQSPETVKAIESIRPVTGTHPAALAAHGARAGRAR